MNQRVIKKVRCNICSAGCPIDAYVEEGTLVSVEGSRDLPGQSGGLCSKGAASKSSQDQKRIWSAGGSILCGISEMVQTGTSAACQCLRVSELLYGIQYLFSVGGNGMEIYLWK